MRKYMYMQAIQQLENVRSGYGEVVSGWLMEAMSEKKKVEMDGRDTVDMVSWKKRYG